MRAIQIVDHSGPRSALRLADVPPPTAPAERIADGTPVRVAVHAAGVSFPELLQTRGRYQLNPPLPFVPGSEVAGVVLEAPPGSGFAEGDRVGAFCLTGGWAEEVVAPAGFTFHLPEEMSYAAGAGFVLNYHSAYYALVVRGQFRRGERVLVHGAAGGLGSATVQLAAALGGEVTAVVSSAAKERLAREAGAARVLRTDGSWKDELLQASGDGVDVVVDPVGGDVATDSLRVLRPGGRYVVVGFTAGSIPQIRTNRLLLRNISAVGAGWGEYAFGRPGGSSEIQEALQPLLESGALRPPVTASYPLPEAGSALTDLDERRVVGKVVLQVR